MKIAKKLVCLSLAACCCFAAAGCTPSSPSRRLPGFVDGKKNLVFFVFDNEDMYDELATEFEAKEGNEEINVIIQKATDSYYEELMMSYIGAQTPDIIFMKTSEIMPFLTTNKLLPLNDYIEASTVMGFEDLWGVNDGYRYNAETMTLGDPSAPLYGIVKDFSPDWTLVYNKEQFRVALGAMTDKSKAAAITQKLERGMQYPSDMTGKDPLDYTLTWSEYYDLALQVKNTFTGVNGTVLDASPEMQIMQWIQMNGEYLFNEDDKTCKSLVNTPGIRSAFELFRKLQDGPTSPAGWSNSTAGGPVLLNQEKVASTCSGRWAFNEYNWIDKLSKFGYMASPLPDNFNEAEKTDYTISSGIGGCMSLCITSKCEYRQEAFKFIEYFFTEFEKEQAQQGYNIPGNKTLAMEYFLDENQDADRLALNSFYYNLGQVSSPMRYNRYIGTDAIYNIMWLNFRDYFYSTNHDSSNPDNPQWIACLNAIETDLNNELRKYYE